MTWRVLDRHAASQLDNDNRIYGAGDKECCFGLRLKQGPGEQDKKK
ncbi:MAG: hypothetical protein ACQEUD_24235 [Bacillota bacterium]